MTELATPRLLARELKIPITLRLKRQHCTTALGAVLRLRPVSESRVQVYAIMTRHWHGIRVGSIPSPNLKLEPMSEQHQGWQAEFSKPRTAIWFDFNLRLRVGPGGPSITVDDDITAAPTPRRRGSPWLVGQPWRTVMICIECHILLIWYLWHE